MGIGSAFSTALTGLTAFSNQTSYISDNLANSSTVGYKRVDGSFSSFVTSSSSTSYSSGGVTITPAYRNTLSGNVTSTSVKTNFAISDGEGYIPVKAATNANGTTTFTSPQYYTRAGDFSLNSEGYLVNSAGYYLEGLKEQTTYASDVANSASLNSLQPVYIDPSVYGSVPGAASTTIKYSANFPASLTASSTASSTSEVSSEVEFYDSLGASHTLTITFNHDSGTATTGGTWSIQSAKIDSDTDVTADLTSSTSLIFGSTGAISSGSPLTLDLSSWSPGNGAAMGTLTIDYSSSTQYAGTSLEVQSTTDETGHASGTYQSCAINSDGYVVLTYSNGQQLKPYRVALVTFSDADKLSRVSGQTFSSNDLESGEPTVSWAGTGKVGTINESSVEASNVDLGDELTTLIVAQRAYSANGKVITTTDQMLQETINLKQ